MWFIRNIIFVFREGQFKHIANDIGYMLCVDQREPTKQIF